MLLAESTPVRRSRGLFLALFAALTLSILSPLAESRTAPFVPPSTIAMRATKSCSFLYTFQAGTTVLQVYAGEVVQFAVIDATQTTFTDVYSWDFGPGALPNTAQNALGSKTLIRHWNTPGTYVVTADLNGSQIEQTLTVIVMADTMVSIEGTFTCDNGYRMAVGTEAEITTVLPSVFNATPAQVLTAETQIVNAPLHGYVYVAAWSDDLEKQGLLGELRRRGAWAFLKGKAAHTGGDSWQVINTGIDFDGPQAPSKLLMENRIANANTTSLWLSDNGLSCGASPLPGFLDVGQGNFPNTQPTICNNFPEITKITQRASWTWFNDLTMACSFTENPEQHEFLLFRFPVDAIPEPPVPPVPLPNLGGVLFCK